MIKKEQHIINQDAPIKAALEKLTALGENLTLFITDETEKVLGVITDGDIRRGLVKGIQLSEPVSQIMNKQFKYLTENKYSFDLIAELKARSIKIVPIVDEEFRIVRFINFAEIKSILPVDVVIMAGGRGERLMPLTRTTPKPMLLINGKPIIEHNVDMLATYGVHNMIISVHYLGDQIKSHFGDGSSKEINITFIDEDRPLGTLGSVRQTKGYKHDDVIVMNSDLLTNINFEDFYKTFKDSDADMAIATTGYNITIPYAVLEISDGIVKSFKEKPTYTYFSNAGIYLIKRKYIDEIPENSFYNATDLISDLISKNKKVISYAILGYWLDIGRHEDYLKAQEDFKHINFR